MASPEALVVGRLVERSLGALTVLHQLQCAMGALLIHTGFALLKGGGAQCSNVLGSVMQVVIEVGIVGIVWWLVGYRITYNTSTPFAGTPSSPPGENDLPHFIISFVQMSLAVSVFASGVAGRAGVEVSCFLMVVVPAVCYPVSAHWVLGEDGWLNPVNPSRLSTGVFDSGGALTVFVFGGVMNLASSAIAGHRRLPDGSPVFTAGKQAQGLEPHDKFYQAAGILMVWLGWNWYTTSTVSVATHPAHAANASMTLLLGTASAVLASNLLSLDGVGYFEMQTSVSGALLGLVTMSACGHVVSPGFAPLIGCLAVPLLSVAKRLRVRCRLDDAMDIGTIFTVGGAWGCISAALLAHGDLVAYAAPRQSDTVGALVGGRGELLGMHVLGLVATAAWAVLCAVVVVYPTLAAWRRVCGRGDAGCETDKEQFGCYYSDVTTLAEFVYTRLRSRPQSKATSAAQSIAQPDEGWLRFASSTPAPKYSYLKAAAKLLAKRVRVAGYAVGLVVLAVKCWVGEGREETASSTLTDSWGDMLQTIKALDGGVNRMWTLLCAFLIFSMQIGFCFLEAGGVRSTNVVNILFKNLGDCSLGVLCWWLVGYAIAYSSGTMLSHVEWRKIAASPSPDDPDASAIQSHFVLSFMYMATATTIVSGAVAERIRLTTYYLLVACISSFLYPVVVHAVWSHEGFLSIHKPMYANGVLDASGSVVIHLYGGTVALLAAWIIGPRELPDKIDVFSPEGQVIVSPHNKFYQAVGTLLLWFGWLPFNAGGVDNFVGSSELAGNAMVTTLLSGAGATVVGVVVARVVCGHFSPGHVCNALLTGLVAITAGCTCIAPIYAPIVGALAVPVYWLFVVVRVKLRIDDVIDAVAVHMGGGLWGGLAPGLFADSALLRKFLGGDRGGADYGVLLGGGGAQLAMQVIGIACVVAWAAGTTLVILGVLNKLRLVRVPLSDELTGLDSSEHRTHSYDYIRFLEAERERALRSIQQANDVADAMIQFDLDQAEAVLNNHDEAGTEKDVLELALRQLLKNLRSYRPYLPQSLFLHESVSLEGSDTSRTPSMESTPPSKLSKLDSATGYRSNPDSDRYGVRPCKATVVDVLCDERGGDFIMQFNTLVAGAEEIFCAHKGVIHRVDGDRVTGLWLPGSTGSGTIPQLACKSALLLTKRVPTVRSSVSTGSAQLGNVGTSSSKYIVVIGKVLNRALMMSHLAAFLQCKVLGCTTTARAVEHVCITRVVDFVQGDLFGHLQELHEIVCTIEPPPNCLEWMYEIEQQRFKAEAQYKQYKATIDHIRGGDFVAAKASLILFLKQHPDDKVASRLARVLQKRLNTPFPGEPRVIESLPFPLLDAEAALYNIRRMAAISALAVSVVTFVNPIVPTSQLSLITRSPTQTSLSSSPSLHSPTPLVRIETASVASSTKRSSISSGYSDRQMSRRASKIHTPTFHPSSNPLIPQLLLQASVRDREKTRSSSIRS